MLVQVFQQRCGTWGVFLNVKLSQSTWFSIIHFRFWTARAKDMRVHQEIKMWYARSKVYLTAWKLMYIIAVMKWGSFLWRNPGEGQAVIIALYANVHRLGWMILRISFDSWLFSTNCCAGLSATGSDHVVMKRIRWPLTKERSWLKTTLQLGSFTCSNLLVEIFSMNPVSDLINAF